MLRDRCLLFAQKVVEASPWYLAPLSWMYAFLVFLRNRCYDLGLFPVKKAKCVVVSVGNIMAGGTGKTPFVHLLAQAFSHRKVAILSRGVGAFADEAKLLQKRLPDVLVLVGKDRARLAKQIENQVDLILLDDGLQHRKLHRDVDIVLVDERKKRYLPWGFLRDSPQRIKKADVVFSVREELSLAVEKIIDLTGKELSDLQGKKVAIFSAIARPERFRKTIIDLGAHIIFEKVFADHGRIDLTKLPQDQLLVCTEKDAVKIQNSPCPIYYLQMGMQVIKGREKWENLIEKIEGKIDNRPTYE